MGESVIVAYGRSAIARAKKGMLSGCHPLDWSAEVLKGVLAKVPQLPPEQIDDLILGCARHENRCNKNMARLLALRAGLPYSVPGQTINRFCSSGLQAIATANNAIAAGEADVIIAGGVEQMSMMLTRNEEYDTNVWLADNEPGAYAAMGITAENVAARCHVTREEMDVFSSASHQKAAMAQAEGFLGRSIVPLELDGRIFDKDEGIRPDSDPEKLAKLKPCFIENGTVTAASSSQTSDGAAFAVLMSREKAETLRIEPVARLVKYAVAGCDPLYMGLGPIYAVPKALEKAGVTVDAMDVIELNEAFAAQSIPCIRELKLPPERVNPWGGAIALGHPMGATGCVLTCKALDYLKETGGRYALVTMCIGGGMGAAGIYERL